jgi:hypothetical protein
MPSSSFTFPSTDGTQIAAYRWDPAGLPKGAVQITHGMGEHARTLPADGAVCGACIDGTPCSDHIGAATDTTGRVLAAAGLRCRS